jgi:anti-anti-sigma factor
MGFAYTPAPDGDGEVRPDVALRAAGTGPLDDDAAARLGADLDRTLDGRPWAVVVDLSDVDSVTSAGLTMLTRVATAAGEGDVGLCLVCSELVRSAIATAGLAELFDQHGSIADALAVLGAPEQDRQG